jgi:hypothetical protein
VIEATPRQVLYALVAGGFLVVVGVLIVGAAAAGVAPIWWTVLAGAMWLIAAIWGARRWRRTGQVLLLTLGLLAVWVVVTLLVATA